MILSIFAIALTAGSTNLSTIVHKTALLDGIVTDPSPHLMAFAALFIVTLAETGRVPVDNPATHLELTMIHEAMVLEYSGRYLALIEWAAGIKLTGVPHPARQCLRALGHRDEPDTGGAGDWPGGLSRQSRRPCRADRHDRMHVCQVAPLSRDRSAGRRLHPGLARAVVFLHFTRLSVSWLTPHIGITVCGSWLSAAAPDLLCHRRAAPAVRLRGSLRFAIALFGHDRRLRRLPDWHSAYLYCRRTDRDRESHRDSSDPEAGDRAAQRDPRIGDEHQRPGQPADLRGAGDDRLFHHAADHSIGTFC